MKALVLIFLGILGSAAAQNVYRLIWKQEFMSCTTNVAFPACSEQKKTYRQDRLVGDYPEIGVYITSVGGGNAQVTVDLSGLKCSPSAVQTVGVPLNAKKMKKVLFECTDPDLSNVVSYFTFKIKVQETNRTCRRKRSPCETTAECCGRKLACCKKKAGHVSKGCWKK